MSQPPLILDTCAIRNKDFLHWLREYHGQKILPAIAYFELSIYFIGKKHREPHIVDDMLNSVGIQVGWFRQREAQDAAIIAIGDGNFRERTKDYMIASYAWIAPRIVVTYNVDDFSFLGSRVKTPDEIMS